MADGVRISLLAALADLVKWLRAAQIPAVIIGGVASSLLGRPRLTLDIDVLAMLPESEWESALTAAQSFGIVPRIEQALDAARESRVLPLKHAESAIDIDLILGGLPFEQEAIARARNHDISGIRVRLPRAEDLIIMKVIAHRAKDLQDVEGLLDARPSINIEEVRQRVRDFASVAAMPDLIEDFERILERYRERRFGSKPQAQ